MITTDAQTEVLAVLAATVQAWSANDAEAFAALYSDDASVVLGGGTFLRGRTEIRDYMAAGFAGPLSGTKGADEAESVRVIGNGAIVVSRSGFRLPGEDAVAPDRRRRATWTLARNDAGWQIEAYHNCPV